VRCWRSIASAGGIVACAGAIVVVGALHVVPGPSRERAAIVSQLVVADDGGLLRGYLASDGRWRLTARLEDVPSHYLDALIAYEDRRFYYHFGVDPVALARVVAQLVRHGRIVSGASTLTMQVVRLLNPGYTGFRGKIMQLVGAIRLERDLTKRDILELYLTLAPFGGNIEGVRAASLFYFGKEPHSLTLNESALLVGIAQAPTRRRPDRHPLAAAEARDRVLARVASGVAREDSSGTSQTSLVASWPLLAPHFADRVRQLEPPATTVRTTINRQLQVSIEQMVRDSLHSWPSEVNAAALVIRNSDCAVRAYVGSGDFLSHDNAGQFDHVQALRSPGSTLKPMIYGLGFEALIIHPSTIVTDRPVNFDGYAPQNFNEDYQGDMTVREALIKSVNTTAVTVLARIGPRILLTRMRSGGVPIQISEPDTSAGLAVALGGGSMTLEALARVYAAIANQGIARPLKMLASASDERGSSWLLKRDVAWALTDILAEVPPPNGFGQRHSGDGGRRIAYKTGTSFGYRDAWAIGFDRDHTIAVWVGRSDAAPNPGAMGITTAAPLMYRIFDLLPTPRGDVAGAAPIGSIFASRTNIPIRLQRLRDARDQHQEHPLRILFPRKGAMIATETDGNGKPFIPLIADGGSPPYFWFLDGTSLPESDPKIRWRPAGPGSVSAALMDSKGEMTSVEFWVR